MINQGNGNIQYEHGEPAMRSCWECNGAHEHLKKVNTVHVCFSCGRHWCYDEYLVAPDDATDEEMTKISLDFFKRHGIAVGESTTKHDKGYRVMVTTFVGKDHKGGTQLPEPLPDNELSQLIEKADKALKDLPGKDNFVQPRNS